MLKTHPTNHLQLLSQSKFERQTLDPIGYVIHCVPCTPCSKDVRWLWNEGHARLLIKNSLPRLQFLSFRFFLEIFCLSWIHQGSSPSAALSQVHPEAALHSENSGRLWLFLGSARIILGKSRENCWRIFSASQKALKF